MPAVTVPSRDAATRVVAQTPRFAAKALVTSVQRGEVPIHLALRKTKLARRDPADLATSSFWERVAATQRANAVTMFGPSQSRAQEVRAQRALDGALEAYRRFSRPERAPKVWAGAAP